MDECKPLVRVGQDRPAALHVAIIAPCLLKGGDRGMRGTKMGIKEVMRGCEVGCNGDAEKGIKGVMGALRGAGGGSVRVLDLYVAYYCALSCVLSYGCVPSFHSIPPALMCAESLRTISWCYHILFAR